MHAHARRSLALLAVQILASVLMGMRADVGYVVPGLDPSYKFAVNYASTHGLRWGEQFVTTLGPLGWVLVPVDMAHVALSWFVAQIVLVIALGAAVTYYVLSLPGIRTLHQYTMALALTYLAHCLTDEYRWLVLFMLVFLLGLHDRTRIGEIANALAGLLAGVYLLIKFSLGLAAILTVAIGCLLPFAGNGRVRRLLTTVASASLGLFVGWAMHYGTLSGIPSHLSMSLSSAAGYASAMSLSPEGWEGPFVSSLTAVGLLAVWVFFQKDRRSSLSLMGMAVPLFITWKHAMVRQDVHERFLVLFGYFIVALLIVDSCPARRRWWSAPFLLAALVAFSVPWFHYSTIDPSSQSLKNALVRPLSLPGIDGLRHLVGLRSYRSALAENSADALEPLRLSASERTLLGDSTVDVYPWEAAYVPANGLRWATRPVPGSFSTYTPRLDELNAKFFASPSRRPQWLLWHITYGIESMLESIDGRHLFWDEPKTLLTILRHYAPVRTGQVWLLRAEDKPRSTSIQPLYTVNAPWGEWTPLPEGEGFLLARIEVQRPWIAHIRRILFREEPAFIEARFRSGDTARYRFVPDQAASGLWINPLPRATEHLEAVFSGRLPRGARVTEIRLRGGWEQHAKRPPTVTWLRLSFDRSSLPLE